MNVRDTEGRKSMPLHFAAGFGRVRVCAFLLHRGADANAADEGGLRPIHNASSFGHEGVVSLLLDKGVDVNVADEWGYTPLHEAARKGKTDVCITLLQRKANASLKTKEGDTPLAIASTDDVKAILGGTYKTDEILEAVKRGDLDALRAYVTPLSVNRRSTDGRQSTPLHLACGYNRYHAVEFLIDMGASVHELDKGGLVALHNACSYGHRKVAEVHKNHNNINNDINNNIIINNVFIIIIN